jgi:hypothetical protein
MYMEPKHGIIMIVVFTAMFWTGAKYLADGEQKLKTEAQNAEAAKTDPRIGRIYTAKSPRLLAIADLDDDAVSNGLTAATAVDLVQKGDAHDAGIGMDLMVRLLAEEKVAIVHRGDRLRVLEANGKALRLENLTRRKGAPKFWLLEEQLISSPKAAAAKRSPASSGSGR